MIHLPRLTLTAEDDMKSANGSSENSHDGGPSCWFWLDKEKAYKKEAKPLNEEKTFTPGDSFKGQNRHGESKDDPEKALKDSRGGAGLNVLDAKPPTNETKDVPQVRKSSRSIKSMI